MLCVIVVVEFISSCDLTTTMADFDAVDKLEQHACGIFACVLANDSSPEDQCDVAKTVYLGLVGLQHR